MESLLDDEKEVKDPAVEKYERYFKSVLFFVYLASFSLQVTSKELQGHRKEVCLSAVLSIRPVKLTLSVYR